MKIEELALQRSKYKHLSDDEWRWFLQQEEGREHTADKLPTFATIDDWWYPVRLSCEQCSSELTAKYKAQIVNGKCQNGKCLDLTGGYGVDTYFLSEQFEHTDYVEQNAELCRIAEHNFNVQKDDVQGTKISIHNTTAEEFLNQIVHRKSSNRQLEYDLIFLDPARRDTHGGKVFRLEDCSPNIVELLPTLLSHLTPDGRLMFKLSPMLDITQAVKELLAFCIQCSVYVVAIKNEVKEVLLVSHQPSEVNIQTITAIDLSEPEKAFVFTREEEQNCPSSSPLSSFTFLYEPNVAILKAGAYKLVAQRFGLHKLDVNTHLYASDTLIENFPGRIWKCLNEPINAKMVHGQIVNVLVRNYPLTAEQLKKKLHLKDGGNQYIIGCRINGKPTVLMAERI